MTALDTTVAETLARAAEEMRVLSQAALDDVGAEPAWWTVENLAEDGGDVPEPDARFIASWRPEVGLAVADWLHACAINAIQQSQSPETVHALAVAEAFLVAAAGVR